MVFPSAIILMIPGLAFASEIKLDAPSTPIIEIAPDPTELPQTALTEKVAVEPIPIQNSVQSVHDNATAKNYGDASGNTYTPGQCTWGVKEWRSDIPNGWGNANMWVSNARKMGWSTGSAPQAGAVGAKGNHVVLVLEVRGDMVLIREMNYNYVPYSIRTSLKPASNYTYIY